MPRCPQCNREFTQLPSKCPSCMADLDLLVDYVADVQAGLQRADELTRAGELDRAVWAYLAVLEADPDNLTARAQVARVAAAVRHFDLTPPGRRRALATAGELPPARRGAFWGWLKFALAVVLTALAFVAGYVAGTTDWSSLGGPPTGPGEPGPAPGNDQMM